MKFRIKKGKELLFLVTQTRSKCGVIINLNDKGTYKGFTQHKHYLNIQTTKGYIELAFTGEVSKLKFESYCKDQVILRKDIIN